MTTVLHGSQVDLVPLSERHAGQTLAWRNDPDNARLLASPRVISSAEHKAWFEGLAGRSDTKFFAVESREDGRHVGNVWLRRMDPGSRTAEVALLMDAVHGRGRGFATESLQLLIRHAFDDLGLERLYAEVLDFNPKAAQAFLRAGFVREDILPQARFCEGRNVDLHLFGLRAGELPCAE
jgi:RimJ/RimL family protein N-acetyltransferase